MLLAWKSAALRSFKVNVPLLRSLKVESGGAWGAQRAGIASVLGTAATNRAGMVVPGPSWSKHLDAHLMGVRSDGVRRLTSSTGLSNEEVEPPRVSCALPFLSSFSAEVDASAARPLHPMQHKGCPMYICFM